MTGSRMTSLTGQGECSIEKSELPQNKLDSFLSGPGSGNGLSEFEGEGANPQFIFGQRGNKKSGCIQYYLQVKESCLLNCQNK